MPEEIYSEKNRLADDGTLVKVLFYDIVRQTRLPAGISAVDADNCYNHIAHLIALLVFFQAVGIKKEACESIFSTIQGLVLVTQKSMLAQRERSKHRECVKETARHRQDGWLTVLR
jgi:hypothetical protein